MSLHAKVCLVVLGTFFVFVLVQNESRKLDGYKFPVYTTPFCPRNETEWISRSSILNCNKSNGLPNENFDELLEFCYIVPVERIQKVCRRKADVEIHDEIEIGPLLGDEKHSNNDTGCSPEEEECTPSIGKDKDKINREQITKLQASPQEYGLLRDHIQEYYKALQDSQMELQREKEKSRHINEQLSRTGYRLDSMVFRTTQERTMAKSYRCSLEEGKEKFNKLERESDRLTIVNEKLTEERDKCEQESFEYRDECRSLRKDLEKLQAECRELLSQTQEGASDGTTGLLQGNYCTSTPMGNEPPIDKAIFDQWEQDDSCFISTKACEEVEKIIKSRNLVIVAGHSGSGKSAIIQHIALQYREQGWTVKRVKKVEDIVDEYFSSRFQKDKTICFCNDPLGKESFDEQLNNSWQTHEEELKLYLKTAKLVMSSRYHIIFDTRVTRDLVNQSDIVIIDDNINKLSVKEKRQILTKYTSDMNLSDEDCSKIVEVEKYFPLLCKLYSSKEENIKKGIEFFKKPETKLKEEINGFRNKDKGKYCALALLVFFNDDLYVNDLLKNKDMENKFKHTLKLCGLPESTPPSDIGDSFNSLKDFFVKKVGNTYHFYHDYVMEVTTHELGTYYFAETIKYADIGFLRRRVKLGNCDEHNDRFTIFLSDNYIEKLGERLFTELFGESLLDVVLNPCLRNEKVIEVLKKKITGDPENQPMLLVKKKLIVDKQKLNWTSKTGEMNKLDFLELENDVSPLFALIVFCHTQLSLHCLNILEEKHTDDFISCFSTVCCNGSTELFNYVCKEDHAEESLKKTWGGLCPIHIVSVFHNYELLSELIKIGVDVNQKTDVNGSWTPLILAASNDTGEYGDYNHRETGETRRKKTVQLLMSNGADINLCMENGASPLYKACQSGHDSTVQLLLSNGADINLCMENGASPLYIACQNGHDSTVQLLLSIGGDINLCMENGAGPLFGACFNGHDSTVQLLLSNGADINLCMENGASPLFLACPNGHDSTVQLLLSNGADINLCMEDGAGPLFAACLGGHNSTVQLLLSNGADINLCMEKRAGLLTAACFGGHDSTVQRLLSNGADINLCDKDGASPLFTACQKGHDSTVQLLLSNGADINLCMEVGTSPLSSAC